jgi:hypothetical protein
VGGASLALGYNYDPVGMTGIDGGHAVAAVRAPDGKIVVINNSITTEYNSRQALEDIQSDPTADKDKLVPEILVYRLQTLIHLGTLSGRYLMMLSVPQSAFGHHLLLRHKVAARSRVETLWFLVIWISNSYENTNTLSGISQQLPSVLVIEDFRYL